MPLLLLALLLVFALLLLLALLPFSLWQRYRLGKQSRRVWPWLNNLNMALLLASSLFLLGWAALSQYWMADALSMAAVGWLLGLVLGAVNLASSHHQMQGGQYRVTPNAWIVLGLTLLVAARLVLMFWQLATHGLDWRSQAYQAEVAWYLRPASLFAVGALLLGHGLAWCWGLRRRLARSRAAFFDKKKT
ncbi:DUF1453 domain-containing protein [Lysobacteraceae bacterium NML08-0793]|nr:DUF1453 domain-containing protein [Xanthomonadaceae bacterium NML08-0793]